MSNDYVYISIIFVGEYYMYKNNTILDELLMIIKIMLPEATLNDIF